MGNKVSGQEYISINGNMVECDGFDNMAISLSTDTNTVNKTTSTNKLTKSTSDQSTKTSNNKQILENLKKEIDKMKPNDSTNSLEKIFAEYDEKTILDYYESTEAINILKQNNEKSVKLAHNLPKNNRGLMFKYFPGIPYELIIIMSKHINFNALDENKYTFLFRYKDVADNIKYVADLIENVDDININLIANNRTFLEYLINNRNYCPDTTDLSRLFNVLEKRKYNFNKFAFNRDTFLTQMLKRYPNNTFDLANALKLKTFNISVESRWLYHLLDNHLYLIQNYVVFMFQREDYKKLLTELYSNLYIDTWDDKFIIFLKKVSTVEQEKIYECLEYKNKDGNTVIHLMAKYHDKQTLQFCVNYFPNLKFEPNNNGKTPLMLYNESKLENKLKYIIK